MRADIDRGLHIACLAAGVDWSWTIGNLEDGKRILPQRQPPCKVCGTTRILAIHNDNRSDAEISVREHAP